MRAPRRSLLALLALLVSAFGGQRLLAVDLQAEHDDGEAYLVASDEVATQPLGPQPLGPAPGTLPPEAQRPLLVLRAPQADRLIVAALPQAGCVLLRGSAGGPRAP